MTVSIPTPIDDHTIYTTNTGNIGSPGSIGKKANGGVPITKDATQWLETTNGVLSGLIWDFSSTQNFGSSKRIYVVSHQFNAPNRVQVDTKANNGMVVRIYSGTNYRQWQIGGNDTAFGKYRREPTAAVIDPRASGDTDNGSYNPNSATRYGFAVKKYDLAGTSSNWNYVQNSVLMGTEKDDANTPRLYGSGVKLKDLHTKVFGTDYSDIEHVYTQSLGDTYFYACPFVIGHASQGSTATSFDDEGITVVSPKSNDSTDPRFRLTTDSMRVHLDLLSGDTVNISGTYVWGTEAPFDFDSSVGATITLNTPSFKGMGNITLGSDVSGPAIYTLGGTSRVVVNGADIDGSTVNGDVTFYSSSVDPTDIVINGDLHINPSSDITLNFYNVSVSGLVYNDNPSYRVTINAFQGSTLTADNPGSGAGQVDIVTQVTVTVTVKDAETKSAIQGARVYVKDTTNGVSLQNTLTDSNGQVSFNYNYVTDVSVLVRARKGSNPPYYKNGEALGTINNTGFEATILLIKDE